MTLEWESAIEGLKLNILIIAIDEKRLFDSGESQDDWGVEHLRTKISS